MHGFDRAGQGPPAWTRCPHDGGGGEHGDGLHDLLGTGLVAQRQAGGSAVVAELVEDLKRAEHALTGEEVEGDCVRPQHASHEQA